MLVGDEADRFASRRWTGPSVRSRYVATVLCDLIRQSGMAECSISCLKDRHLVGDGAGRVRSPVCGDEFGLREPPPLSRSLAGDRAPAQGVLTSVSRGRSRQLPRSRCHRFKDALGSAGRRRVQVGPASRLAGRRHHRSPIAHETAISTLADRHPDSDPCQRIHSEAPRAPHRTSLSGNNDTRVGNASW